jgi:hypothetical protein
VSPSSLLGGSRPWVRASVKPESASNQDAYWCVPGDHLDVIEVITVDKEVPGTVGVAPAGRLR